MKSFFFFCAAILCASNLLAAVEPRDELANAIRALGDKSYRWDTQGKGPNVPENPLEGKTDPTGLTEWSVKVGKRWWIMVVRDGRGAMYIDGKWRTLDEAWRIAIAGISGPSDPKVPQRVGNLIITGASMSHIDETGQAAYVIARVLKLRRPAAQIDWYLANAVSVEAKGGAFLLTLDEPAAKMIGEIPSSVPGYKPIRIENTQGTVRISLADGVISNCAVAVSWKQDGELRTRTWDTRFKKVGARIEVSPEALQLLN
ncbi:MAG TPA: hypothetical protein VHO24_12300 [Opitutaceae bacterium]|nr:hypothetical protein [Opitutaceae bacterium]